MNNKTKLSIFILLFLSFIGSAFAQDEPLMPDVAFKFDAVVKNDHVLATWTIANDYYMYREKFHFKSATPGVILGKPEFPQGKMKHGIKPDGSEGMVETYMRKVTINIPIAKSSGSQLKLIAKGQGCAEKLGICYPPQTREKLLTLASASTSTESGVSALNSQLGLGGNDSDEPMSPQKAFQFNARAKGNNILATWTIAPGTHMYKSEFSFKAKTPGLKLGTPELPQGEMKQGIKPDGTEGMVEVYEHSVTITVPYTLSNKVDGIEIVANGQGCNDECTSCVTPQHRTALSSVTQSAAVASTTSTSPTAAGPAPAGEGTGAAPAAAKSSSFWHIIGILAFAFLSGLALTFTPCVLPMLPIISSIIIGQGDKVTKTRGGFLALIYVLGTALVWTIAGAVAGASGQQLQAYTSSPYFVLPVAIILILLSLAMFGIYNLQMPASLQSRAQEKSTGLKSGTVLGVFIMGVLASVIAGACVSPILILNLGVAMQAHDAVLGGGIMLLMALGMGVPIILIGIGAGWLLPKAGTWMDTVKYVFGVMLIGLALYIMSTIPWIPVLYLWAPFLIVTGVYMGAARALPEGASGWHTLWKGLGVFLVIWGILALIGAMQGNRDILQPIRLSAVTSGSSAVATASNPEAMFTRVANLQDMEAKLASARAAGKPVFLDYYATWCTDCNLMKKSVFSDSQVQQYMREHFVVLQADVSDQFNKNTQPMKDKFGVFGPPALLFFNSQGKLVKKEYGLLSKAEFLKIVKSVAKGQ
ncbi:MAG: protein-disulfide reductase DsbD [Gammaproteobacteria bacterium]